MTRNCLLFGTLVFNMLLLSNTTFSQLYSNQQPSLNTEADTSWYVDLSDKFIVRVYSLYKSNNVNIIKDTSFVKYRPNGTINLGIGFNYKFIGLGVSFGMPLTKGSRDKYGDTQRFDIQASMYSRRIGMDGHFQAYRGYYISNPDQIGQWSSDNYPTLPDMRVLTIGFNAFYIFNNEKFSYKSAFVRNQLQKKKAGSFTGGIFGTYDEVKTDNGLIPNDFPDSLRTTLDLKHFRAATYGITIGYMYNFVISDHFYANLAAVPGLGYRNYYMENIAGETEQKGKIAAQMLLRAAIAFDIKSWYLNFTASMNNRSYHYNEYNIELSSEQLRLTFGKRL